MLSLLSITSLANSSSDTSNGTDLSELVTSDNIEIFSDQDFIDLGFSGTGSESDPYLIENLEITGDNVNDNIEIRDTTKYFIIQNCLLINGYEGIDIMDIAPGTAQVINNHCELSYHNGLWMENVIDAYVVNNEMITNGISGIRLENCSAILITENTIDDNTGVGIVIANSADITFTWNIVTNQYFSGISIMHSNGSLIAYNHIEQHNEYSIKINYGSCENVMHHNNNIECNLDATGESQATDAGSFNIWYEEATLEGNYWEDWDGEGNYPLTGAANCCDPYPLEKPYNIKASFPY